MLRWLLANQIGPSLRPIQLVFQLKHAGALECIWTWSGHFWGVYGSQSPTLLSTNTSDGRYLSRRRIPEKGTPCPWFDIDMFIVFNYQRPIGSRIPLVEPLGQGYRARDNDGWLGREAQVTECVWFDKQARSRWYHLEGESWSNRTGDQKTSRMKGKTPEHMHAGVLKFICLKQMTSSHPVGGHSRLFFSNKTFFSTTYSGLFSTRSLQFNVLLDEDF
jgi:hypothetical protein